MVLSGPDEACLRYIDNTDAFFLVTYNEGFLDNDQNVGYVPTVCASDYFPISDNDEVTGWVWESQTVTIGLEEFETLLEQGCRITSTVDALDDFNQLSVFPNPVNEILTISYPDKSTVLTTELYDNLGNLVKKSNRTSIDMNNLNAGIYFVKIYNQHSSCLLYTSDAADE